METEVLLQWGGCSCWSRPRFSEQQAHTRPLESWSAHRAWLGGAWTVHRDPTPRPRRCLACRPDFPARSPHSLSRVLCSGRRSPRPGRSPDPAHVPSLPRLPPCHSLHLQCPPLPTLLNKSYPCPKAQRGAVSPTKPLRSCYPRRRSGGGARPGSPRESYHDDPHPQTPSPQLCSWE